VTRLGLNGGAIASFKGIYAFQACLKLTRSLEYALRDAGVIGGMDTFKYCQQRIFP
jgi:hypothetical protein